MPIYEYICEECSERYEHLALRSGDNAACPKCGSHRHMLQFSVFAPGANGESKSISSSASDGPASSCCGGSCGCGRR
jgi:putative FmdB family regulatory protein